MADTNLVVGALKFCAPSIGQLPRSMIHPAMPEVPENDPRKNTGPKSITTIADTNK
jgi:hypothetical protein